MVALPGAAPLPPAPSSISCNSSTRVEQAVKTSCFSANGEGTSPNWSIVCRLECQKHRQQHWEAEVLACLGQTMDWQTNQEFKGEFQVGGEIAISSLVSSPHILG